MLAARKTAADRLDYDMDFSQYLSVTDSVQSAEAEVDPGITLEAIRLYPRIVKLWLDGGTPGESYKITLTAATAEGRIKEVGLTVRVVEN